MRDRLKLLHFSGNAVSCECSEWASDQWQWFVLFYWHKQKKWYQGKGKVTKIIKKLWL